MVRCISSEQRKVWTTQHKAMQGIIGINPQDILIYFDTVKELDGGLENSLSNKE